MTIFPYKYWNADLQDFNGFTQINKRLRFRFRIFLTLTLTSALFLLSCSFCVYLRPIAFFSFYLDNIYPLLYHFLIQGKYNIYRTQMNAEKEDLR